MTPDPSPSAIQAQGLAKRFDKVQAVSAVDFKVRSGELFIDITGIKAEIMGREKEKTGGGSR